MMRPYFYVAVGFAFASIPFLVAKAYFALRCQPRIPAAVLIAASATFSLAHMGSARYMMSWARKRYELGLMGFGYPWEEGEADRLYQKHRSQQQEHLIPQEQPEAPHLLPQDLADPDSQFTTIKSVSVHYKIAYPEALCFPGCGILLLHPFGGGAFSFRLLMRSMAEETGCPVVSFDRPGAGLTSRPAASDFGPGHSPYAPDFALDIAEALCTQLHIKYCIFVGQADGSALAALIAARLKGGDEKGRGASTAGLVLLHPTNMEEGEAGSSFSRLLSNSRIGRRLLLRMLRADIPNRGAWAEPTHVTPDIVELYKEPSWLEGWEKAIIEVTCAQVGKAPMQECMREVQGLPVLIITGAKDRCANDLLMRRFLRDS
ncbi:hypothetical protein CVIRNUC_007427 [Coccomyxa viridis]|uniref:AB hydrolase-1 domain-containing protein n=1 Tax=Coccomyxa viridis TaxID=1274662 RepID=A0AAV1IAI6_9CHLO|nr:hypothetical protein CVIRNUC_007427 [Coccomyxa viridis]